MELLAYLRSESTCLAALAAVRKLSGCMLHRYQQCGVVMVLWRPDAAR